MPHENGCAGHGERLASIEALLIGVKEQTTKTNGRTTVLEAEIVRLREREAAHAAMSLQAAANSKRHDEEIEQMKAFLDQLKSWQDTHAGEQTGRSNWIVNALAVGMFAITIWMGWSSHVQAQASNAQGQAAIEAILKIEQRLK